MLRVGSPGRECPAPTLLGGQPFPQRPRGNQHAQRVEPGGCHRAGAPWGRSEESAGRVGREGRLGGASETSGVRRVVIAPEREGSDLVGLVGSRFLGERDHRITRPRDQTTPAHFLLAHVLPAHVLPAHADACGEPLLRRPNAAPLAPPGPRAPPPRATPLAPPPSRHPGHARPPLRRPAALQVPPVPRTAAPSIRSPPCAPPSRCHSTRAPSAPSRRLPLERSPWVATPRSAPVRGDGGPARGHRSLQPGLGLLPGVRDG